MTNPLVFEKLLAFAWIHYKSMVILHKLANNILQFIEYLKDFIQKYMQQIQHGWIQENQPHNEPSAFEDDDDDFEEFDV